MLFKISLLFSTTVTLIFSGNSCLNRDLFFFLLNSIISLQPCKLRILIKELYLPAGMEPLFHFKRRLIDFLLLLSYKENTGSIPDIVNFLFGLSNHQTLLSLFIRIVHLFQHVYLLYISLMVLIIVENKKSLQYSTAMYL